MDPQTAYRAQDSGRVRPVCTGGFQVETDHLRPHLGKALDVFFGMDDHQVYVHRFFRFLCNGLDDRKAERDIGHKGPVHHIQMEKVGIPIHHFHIFFQMQKIGRKHRGSYFDRHLFIH